MDWLLLALTAYFGLAIVAVIDKYLLVGPVRSPALYAGTVGILGIFTLALIPLGFSIPQPIDIVLSVISGTAFIIALIAYFTALKKSEATRVVPLASAFVPLLTLLFAYITGQESLNFAHLTGIAFLVIGGVIITSRSFKLRHIESSTFFLTILASFLFAIHFIAAKKIYNDQPFINGLIWLNLGKVLAAAVLLAKLKLTGKLHPHLATAAKPRSVTLFFSGRVIAAISGLAQNYAISFASVSVITALQGFQYAFLFLLVWLAHKHGWLLNEKFSKKIVGQKIFAIILLSIGLLLISQPVKKQQAPAWEYGVTFSKTFAHRGLALDWRVVYKDIVRELPIDWIRIPAYWDDVQPSMSEWRLDDIEFQVELARQKNIGVILAVGRKLPRWPECHVPEWAQALSEQEQKIALLKYIKEIISAYDNHPAIAAFQIENEPLLDFGICPEPDKNFLTQEVRLAKNLTQKPIIISDSGELSNWTPEAKLADILGTTMYRHIYDYRVGQVFYPLPSGFFNVKARITRVLSGKSNLHIMNIELQAEPWGPRPLDELKLKRQLELMNAEQLTDNVEYAKRTGFSPILFWGAEWWWWMKNVNNDPTLWDTAKEIMGE